MTILWISVAVIALFLVFGVMGSSLSKKAGKGARQFVEAIDRKYEDYVDNLVAGTIVREGSVNLDGEAIVRDVLVLLKPDLDGLFSHINKTTLSDVSLGYQSRYFANLVSLAEFFFSQRHQNEKVLLTEQDRAKLDSTVADAIRADLIRRQSEINAGRL